MWITKAYLGGTERGGARGLEGRRRCEVEQSPDREQGLQGWALWPWAVASLLLAEFGLLLTPD